MKKIWPYLIILIAILPAARYLFGPGYFNMHDDLQVMRIFQIEKCFADGQIPCRWVPDMVYGYGQALFNFYSAFPYYLGALIRLITPLSIIGTVKLLFFISFAGSAVGMYLLTKEFWGKWGGIVSAILYAYAPYHALDIFVRGALAESFALAILPFVWLTIHLLIKKSSFKSVLALSISLFALFTTHNISSLIYAPFTAVWALFWIIKFKNPKSILYIGLSGILGLGLSAFFLLPAIFEQFLIQTQYLTINYLNYVAHFTTLKQLFINRNWGYGPSIFGPNDNISFQIGWPYWWLIFVLVPLGIYWWKEKEKKVLSLMLFLLTGLGLFTAFLTHERSTFIWKAIPVMNLIQFPWRFLGLVIFSLSFAIGAAAFETFKRRKLYAAGIILLTIIFNVFYFKPQYFSTKVDDKEKLSGEAFYLQQKSAVLDYLPKTCPIPPEQLAPKLPKAVKGEGFFSNFHKSSNRFSFDAEIVSDAEIQIPIMYFPGWSVIIGRDKIPGFASGDHGEITINLKKGNYIILGRFEDTPIRSFGNAVTGITFLIIFGATLYYVNKNEAPST